MKALIPHRVRCLIQNAFWYLLAIALLLTPVNGQRRATPKRTVAELQSQPTPPTFDTLLAADSYKIYGEVRGVGQLIRSDGLKDLLDPVIKLAAPPREFKSLIKWLNVRADSLMTSRLLFAAWPSRPQLPQVLVAIEFPSVEEARKFEPQLREFLPRLLPTPTPESSSGPSQNRVETTGTKQGEKVPGLSYVLKQSGSLVFITNAPFALRDLKPARSRPLSEDQNFRVVHDRFNSEQIFIYVDISAIEKEENELRQKFEEEQKQNQAEAAKQVQPDNQTAGTSDAQRQVATTPGDTSTDATLEPTVGPLQPEGPLNAGPVSENSTARVESNESNQLEALSGLSSALFWGRAKWPDGIGAAFVFDGDSYITRVLFVSSSEAKSSLIPFVPQFVSGPAIVPESPSILPADTELFVTASIDFTQIYEGMLKSATAQFEQIQRHKQQTIKISEPTSPFEIYEKKFGIKIREDLLPLLGNEIAFTIPVKALDAGAQIESSSAGQQAEEEGKQKPEGSNPIFVISVEDREAVRKLLPKLIDSLGFKGASMLVQAEKREDTELVSYGNALSFAFIGNFLVVSPDVKATRHVVDSYLSHETLSSSAHFRNYTRWQPRQVLGQIYVSPALMESYNSFATTGQISDQLRDFLMLLSPVAEPVTYAVSNDGLGPFHELHVPKNLALLMIAAISGQSSQSPMGVNEAVTRSAMRAIGSAEATYQSTEGAGRYGTLDELIKAGLISKEMVQNYGYRIDLNVSGTRFEISAVPVEYGKTGKLSFFVDESLVLRVGDHAGGPATIADKATR